MNSITDLSRNDGHFHQVAIVTTVQCFLAICSACNKKIVLKVESVVASIAAARVASPGEILPIMDNTGMLRPIGVPFSS